MTAPTHRTISAAQLLAADLAGATPALVIGLRVLPQLWTPADIVEQVGDTIVPVRKIRGGDYIGSGVEHQTVGDYYAAIAGGVDTDPVPYLAELSYDEHFPALAAQLTDPPRLRNEDFTLRVMYFGTGVHSQIHYHTEGSALLFCIHGSKMVRLFAPDQTPRLSKVPRRNFSRILVSSIGRNDYEYDRRAFPEFADAEYVEYRIEAGQVLFIPMYWWHSIQNLDDVSLTAVYFWRRSWKGTWRDVLPPDRPPAGMRTDYVVQIANRHLGDPVRKAIRAVRNR